MMSKEFKKMWQLRLWLKMQGRLSVAMFILVLTFVVNGNYAQTGHQLRFSSSDTSLEHSFRWASKMALHYKGQPGDPVGPWYESALPPRNAFCMRDVSHQSIGGAILGLDRENKNMMSLFVSNISQGKDWCSYWEMNREGKPAPEDYRNDTAFWYNLPANFDVLYACWRLYLWTGDSAYINDPRFTHFFDISVTKFIDRWVLQEGKLLTRPTHPHAPASYNERDAFSRCRGLPSYSEGVHNIKMGVDLVAAIYRGLMTYGDIMAHKGNKGLADRYYKKAKAYQMHIEDKWWDPSASLYNTYYSDQLQFGKTEGETFLLWFDALRPGGQKTKTIGHLLSRRWNVENSSYLPLILYRNGYNREAYEEIRYLTSPSTKRREYPEVSFGVVEAMVQGLMGIDADASCGRIVTRYRSDSVKTCSIERLPVLGTRINVTHTGLKQTTVENAGTRPFTWRAVFNGNFSRALVGHKQVTVQHRKDENGTVISSVDVYLKAGMGATVRVL